MGPLTGVKVVEIASLAPAPFGCMILADLGAEVLRVDRASGSAAVTPPAGPLDRGRRSVAVDLKSPEGVAAVKRFVRDADVFIEGFRPGVAERLGIGPDELLAVNPRLIYGRMTGWGQEGPLAPRAGHDINYIAIAGALEPIGRAGERPHAPLNLLGDFAGGGSFLALGVLAALYERERSGKGQVIDAAMVDGANILMSFLHGMRAGGMWPNPRGENMLDGAAPFYDTYETADGKYVAVGCVEPQFYAQLLDKLGIDAAGLPFQMDPAGFEETKKLVGEAFRTKNRDEWASLCADSDACVSPVLSPWEAHEHPHNQARKAFVEVGGMIQPAPAPRFSRSQLDEPVAMDTGGRDIAAALTAWGLPESEIADLTRACTVR
ncbi:CaiB/BaiF CoA-transferase family protein [Nocardia sp. XZ_19_385]|uniref:CaiB/BaiF CoA transferase family protein n=1 Tax=Nocardia sp. XZ_19_385 TaxID=2769488 RepID=UPI00188EF358|nr:CaiB/BaiF CoA-transferase family protein [Nocardia sp. XZ_19_385]